MKHVGVYYVGPFKVNALYACRPRAGGGSILKCELLLIGHLCKGCVQSFLDVKRQYFQLPLRFNIDTMRSIFMFLGL